MSPLTKWLLSMALLTVTLNGMSRADLGSSEYQYGIYTSNRSVYFMKANSSGILENRFWHTIRGTGQLVADDKVNDEKYDKRIIVIIPHLTFMLAFIEGRAPYYGDLMLTADKHCPDPDCDAQFIGYKEIISPTQAAKDIGDFIVNSNNETAKPTDLTIIATPEFVNEVSEINGHPILPVKYLATIIQRSRGYLR